MLTYKMVILLALLMGQTLHTLDITLKLCPVAHIEEYVKRTSDIRGDQCKFFIIGRNPIKKFQAILLVVGSKICKAQGGHKNPRLESTTTSQLQHRPILEIVC